MDTDQTLAGKTSRISVKVEESLKKRVERVESATGIGEASLVRHLATAMCQYAETYGEITLPFAVVPRNELSRLKALDDRVKELELGTGENLDKPQSSPMLHA